VKIKAKKMLVEARNQKDLVCSREEDIERMPHLQDWPRRIQRIFLSYILEIIITFTQVL
jgi:hypothetical protein